MGVVVEVEVVEFFFIFILFFILCSKSTAANIVKS